MLAIYWKEITAFFSSLIAYIVIVTFLVATGLFVWILPTNVLDEGYATLSPLFEIGPWVFMFLIPAITMRSFAEEKKTGTFEILATKPITEWKIVLAKYFAGLTLVFFALIPTFFYVYAINQLASPVGNVDMAAIWGSYLGLLLLGGAYVSIGIFASSITDNQIVGFIAGAFLCFVFFALFEFIRDFNFLNFTDVLLEKLSIQTYYASLSRGVIDVKDVVYFFSLSGIFLSLAKFLISAAKWRA